MRLIVQIIFIAILILAASGIVFSHCDTLDGPVIMAAKKALDTGNMNLVLIWVQKKHEAEISKAFQETLSMRKMNPLIGEVQEELIKRYQEVKDKQ
ncbi:DUF6448 family protein, partial [bacterium]|nr:DUF6448 family protein [bacterium]